MKKHKVLIIISAVIVGLILLVPLYVKSTYADMYNVKLPKTYQLAYVFEGGNPFGLDSGPWIERYFVDDRSVEEVKTETNKILLDQGFRQTRNIHLDTYLNKGNKIYLTLIIFDRESLKQYEGPNSTVYKQITAIRGQTIIQVYTQNGNSIDPAYYK